MLQISYAGCLGVSRMVSAQFTLHICIAAWNREKFTKNPYFGVQVRRSMSLMLVPPERSFLCFQSTKSATAIFFNICFVFRIAKAQMDATFPQKRYNYLEFYYI